MTQDESFREELVAALRGGHAYMTFDQMIADFPVDRAGVRPPGIAHSAWELLEHIRIALKDILDFSLSANHKILKWPDDYWPAAPQPESEAQWHESVKMFQSGMAEFEALVRDPGRDLAAAFPWGEGQTLMRETLLVIEHNSYHLGQLLLVRRALENVKTR